MSDDEDQMSRGVKISLIGNSGVGKTCIIYRYTHSKFDENSVSTQGANYSPKVVNIKGKDIHLDIWDTAGQEQYRSLGRHFYKDSYIVILVYDVTQRDSFDDLKNIWYNDLKKCGEKYIVLGIAGNKSDLYEKEEIPEEEARKYAEEINATYMAVSAKTGTNIEILFENLISRYLEKEFQTHVEEMSQKSKSTVKLKRNMKNNNKAKNSCC